MATPGEYNPPSSAAIKKRQNETDALRLLIAQRRLYRQAKRWLGLRWVGMIVIGLAAPVISVIWESIAVVMGAIAGVWIFFARTLLLAAQTAITVRAASVQEQFDFYVFEMPDNASRSTLPSLEEIAAVAGPDDQIVTSAKAEKLIDWYSVDTKVRGADAIAIAMRSNASYADRLLRTTAKVWAISTGLWTLVLIILSAALGLSLSTFLLGVALPVLPAFLDVVHYINGVWRSAQDRGDLAQLIEDRVNDKDNPVEGQDLLVWQERLFELRRSAPEVPDFLYGLRRKVNERAMHTAANQLSRRARKR